MMDHILHPNHAIGNTSLSIGPLLASALFIVQNTVIGAFWLNLHSAEPGVQVIINAAAPHIFANNYAQGVRLD